jgi:hypothetical protein
MSNLSPTTQALLRAARQDGPSAAGRSQIWSSVAAKAAGKVALGAGAAGGKAAAGAATAKLFVMGALLGSAVTVGVAALALHIGAPSLRPDPTVVVRADTDGENLTPPRHSAPPAPAAALTATDTPPRGAGSGKHAGHARLPGDSLGHEAQLVEEARGAIVRGEPEAALSALHAAQALPDHALEPEELSLEVRALRAMGRLDDANVADARLRAKFPDHALAR